MEVVNDTLANGVTYHIDINGRVLTKLYNVFLEAADDERGRFSPLLQQLKSDTPRQHDQKAGIHSLQIENKEDNSTRLIVKTKGYRYTDAQLNAIFETVVDYTEAGTPLLDENGLDAFDAQKRKERGDFEPDEALAKTNPELYMAQACVAAAMNRVYPVVRGDGGDLAVMGVQLKDNVLNLDLIASGSCMGCGGATLATMPKVRQYIGDMLAGDLPHIKFGEIAVYSDYSMNSPAYWVMENGVRQPDGSVTQPRFKR